MRDTAMEELARRAADSELSGRPPHASVREDVMDQRNRSRRARAGAMKRGTRRAAKSAKQSAADLPDLSSILGRFSDALSVLAVVQRSLSLHEFAGVGDEEITLRRVIDELKAVYDDIDSTVPLLRAAGAARPEVSEPDE
jgi:hypothetical protein